MEDRTYKLELDFFGYIDEPAYIEIVVDVCGNGRSQSNLVNPDLKWEEMIAYDHALNAVESLVLAHACNAVASLVLAHACAGIDVASEEYVAGVMDACAAIANNLCDAEDGKRQ